MFRRLSAVLVIVACLGLLSACAPAAEQVSPTCVGFSCHVDVTYRDMSLKGQLSRMAAGTLTIAIEAPASLNGMTMTFDGEQIRVTMLGLSVALDPANIPQSALGSALLDTLDAALRAQDQAVLSDGVMTLSGECTAGGYTVTSDPQTGALLTVTVPALDMTAAFTDFRITA